MTMQQQILADIIGMLSSRVRDAMKFQKTDAARHVLATMERRIEAIAYLKLDLEKLSEFEDINIARWTTEWPKPWEDARVDTRLINWADRKQNVDNQLLDELVPLHQTMLAIAAQSNPFDRQYWIDLANTVNSLALKTLNERYHEEWTSHREYQLTGLPPQQPIDRVMNVLSL